MNAPTKPGRPPLDENAPSERITFRITAEMVAALKERARREGRKPAELIREALAAHMDDERAAS